MSNFVPVEVLREDEYRVTHELSGIFNKKKQEMFPTVYFTDEERDTKLKDLNKL